MFPLLTRYVFMSASVSRVTVPPPSVPFAGMVPGGLPGASLGMAGRLPGHPMTGAVLLVSNLDEEVGTGFGCFISSCQCKS